MSKRKKLLLTIVAAVVVIGGVLGGTAVALAGDEEEEQAQTFLDRVAEIYEANTGTPIDAGQLETALQQAREEKMTDARDSMFDKLVEDGILTQEEADEFKAWMDAKPDIDIDLPRLDRPFGRMFRDAEERFGHIHNFMFKMRDSDRTDTTDTQ